MPRDNTTSLVRIWRDPASSLRKIDVHTTRPIKFHLTDLSVKYSAADLLVTTDELRRPIPPTGRGFWLWLWGPQKEHQEGSRKWKPSRVGHDHVCANQDPSPSMRQVYSGLVWELTGRRGQYEGGQWCTGGCTDRTVWCSEKLTTLARSPP